MRKKPSAEDTSGKIKWRINEFLNWDQMLSMLHRGTLGTKWAKIEMHTDEPIYILGQSQRQRQSKMEWGGGQNSKGYWRSCKKEHKTLVLMNVWEIVTHDEWWMNVIPSTCGLLNVKDSQTSTPESLRCYFWLHGAIQLGLFPCWAFPFRTQLLKYGSSRLLHAWLEPHSCLSAIYPQIIISSDG
jgi:hypothetical protein